MNRTPAFVLVLSATFMGLWPQAARAQSSGIEGTVADTTGGVLPGVTVEISNPNLPDGITVAFTDGTGRYSVLVPAGTYDVSFNLPGFALIERNRVVVAESAMTTMDAEMRIGGLAEQVSVVATGTAIDAPAINLPHAVAVVSRAMLEEQGAPQLVDLFKNIGASHGVIGERSSWYNADQAATIAETVANVNLRGLGASRSLVLINGRRQTYVPARLIGPLSGWALAILHDARRRRDGTGLVFLSPRGKPLSDMTPSKLIKELGTAAVPHGCGRSGSFIHCSRTGASAINCCYPALISF